MTDKEIDIEAIERMLKNGIKLQSVLAGQENLKAPYPINANDLGMYRASAVLADPRHYDARGSAEFAAVGLQAVRETLAVQLVENLRRNIARGHGPFAELALSAAPSVEQVIHWIEMIASSGVVWTATGDMRVLKVNPHKTVTARPALLLGHGFLKDPAGQLLLNTDYRHRDSSSEWLLRVTTQEINK